MGVTTSEDHVCGFLVSFRVDVLLEAISLGQPNENTCFVSRLNSQSYSSL